jgi:hypothetical protein
MAPSTTRPNRYWWVPVVLVAAVGIVVPAVGLAVALVLAAVFAMRKDTDRRTLVGVTAIAAFLALMLLLGVAAYSRVGV